MSNRRKRALPPWLSGVTVGKQSKQNGIQGGEPTSQPHANNVCLNTVTVESDPKQRDVSISDSDRKANFESSTEASNSASGNSDDLEKDKSGVTNQTNTNKACKTVSKGGIDKLSDGQGEKETAMTVEEIVALSYPEYKFTGSIVYSYNSDDTNIICDDILSSIDNDKDIFIGFDTEWPVTFQKGKQAKTALIQICMSEDKCYLFHISCMAKFPVMLKKLIEKQTIKKVGLNIEYDLWKLEADYDLRVKNIVQSGIVELKTLANKKLKSAETWSLAGLTMNVLRKRLSKDPRVRTCDWSEYPLPEEQKQYAAGDAAVSLLLYKELMKIQR